jgi:hypothetical protein
MAKTFTKNVLNVVSVCCHKIWSIYALGFGFEKRVSIYNDEVFFFILNGCFNV